MNLQILQITSFLFWSNEYFFFKFQVQCVKRLDLMLQISEAAKGTG